MDKWLKRPVEAVEECSVQETSDLPCTSSKVTNVDLNLSRKKQKTVTRRYDSNYLKMGFSFVDVNEEPRPQCVICFEVFSNHSMKPSLLQRHFNLKHRNLSEKPLDFFKRKEVELQGGQKKIAAFSTSNENAVKASFLASLRIAKCGKPHTIGEKLILPAAKDIVNCVLGEKAAKQLDSVSLSDSTVSRRILVMANDVKETVIEQIKSSIFFALQMDESTDVTNFAQLMVYCRFLHGNEIKEDFLFCESLLSTTTSVEIFNKVNDFITKHGLDWLKCVGICSDGARAMTGKHGGVVTRIKAVAPECVFIHCSIHRQALAAKGMPDELRQILNDAVKVVNFIKSRALNSRLFRLLCSEMGSIHDSLLLHTEVRWLSRGKVLSRLFELRSEVQIFLAKENHELKDKFTDEIWLCQLAYLSDIFNRLNDLNLGLQGKHTTRFVIIDKVGSFIKKLELVKSSLENSSVQHFPALESFVVDNEIKISSKVLLNFKIHCVKLIKQFNEYFTENYFEFEWIRNPFLVESPAQGLSATEQEKLIDLSCDGELKLEFKQCDLGEFWARRNFDYPSLAKHALKYLIPFSTTYLCENGFSAMLYIKNVYRNKLNVEPDLRLYLSNTEPDINKLCGNTQAQPSH